MESDILDLSKNFIENQKRQIELANQLIEHANGNEEVIRLVNELIRSCEKCIKIEQKYEQIMKKKDILTPIEREIINGKNKLELFKCVDRVKRYYFAKYTELTSFITINEFLERDFYTDEGEYEAYLSDGKYFIGVNLHWLGDKECKEFIDKNKHLFGKTKTLCIYFVDYPEDK